MSDTRTLTARDVVGHRIAELRRRRGLTAAQLSERCRELGATHISWSSVANIESRRRGLSIDDLLVYAAGLDVAPLDLLTLSPEKDETLAVTSTITADADLLRGWLTGQAALPESNARLYYSAVLEQMDPPSGITMTAYAKAVVEERTAQIAAQYEQEATELLRRTRTQAIELLDDLAAAVTDGASTTDLLERLAAVKERITAP